MKDRTEDSEIKVAHCPTNRMIRNYFIKPLHGGNKLIEFRRIIMSLHLISSKECVVSIVEDVPIGKEGRVLVIIIKD